MLKIELLKLTPKERDVIFLWRFLNYPKQLLCEEIKEQCRDHSIKFIKATIKKFQKNTRMKLEAYNYEQDTKEILKDWLIAHKRK